MLAPSGAPVEFRASLSFPTASVQAG